eukprot:gene11376-12562_t
MAAAFENCSENDLLFRLSHEEVDVVSETGITLSSEHIEEMIADEIKKTHSKKQRADTNSICKSLRRTHGLTGSTVTMQLKYMIATERVIKGLHNGQETLSLREEAKNKKLNGTEPKRNSFSINEKRAECQTDSHEQASRIRQTESSTSDKDVDEGTNMSLNKVIKPQSNSDLKSGHSHASNDSFLCFLDGVKTPTSDHVHKDLHHFPSEDLNISSFLNIIQTLVESNASLNEMIKTERRNNTVLTNENSGLKLEIQKMKTKTKMCTQIPSAKESNIASAQPKPHNMVNDSGQKANDSIEQRLAKQLKEVQKLKHEEFKCLKSVGRNKDSSCAVSQNNVSKANIASPSAPPKHSGSATTEKDKCTRRAKNNRKNKEQNKQLKNKTTHNAAENGGNVNANSSTTNVDGKTAPVKKRILLLGDSHVRRLNDCKLLPDSIVAKSIGGLRSNQIISRHKQTINSELTTTDEVSLSDVQVM